MFNNLSIGKGSIFFALIVIAYGGYLYLSTLGVEMVVLEPINCQKIAELRTQSFSDTGIISRLSLKRDAKKLGADTVHIPINPFNVVNKRKILSGTAYDCSTSTF